MLEYKNIACDLTSTSDFAAMVRSFNSKGDIKWSNMSPLSLNNHSLYIATAC